MDLRKDVPMSSTRKYCTSNIVTYHTTFTWVINDFKNRLELTYNNKKGFSLVLQSSSFTLTNSRYSCHLKLRVDPNFSSNYDNSLSLHEDSLEGSVFKDSEKLQVKMSILYGDIEKNVQMKSTPDALEDHQVSTSSLYPKYYLQFVVPATSKLMSKQNEQYLENDTLTFFCEILQICDIKGEREFKIHDVKEGELGFMPRAIQEFYKKQHLFDVTFTIGTEKLRAHSIVLASVSPYFLAMFNNAKNKESAGEVDFTDDPDISPKIFKGFLDYIYGLKTVEDLQDIVDSLLILGDKFDIANLRNLCENNLYKSVDKTNAAKMLLFADKYNCKILKERALSVAKANMDEIKNSSDFEQLFQNKGLIVELL